MTNEQGPEEYTDLNGVAKALGLRAQRTAQLIQLYIKTGEIPDLIIKTPPGEKYLYPKTFVQTIKQTYEGHKGTREGVEALMIKEEQAKLTIPVNIYDAKQKDILLLKFGNIDRISAVLQRKVEEMLRPTMAQLVDFEGRMQKEKAQLIRNA